MDESTLLREAIGIDGVPISRDQLGAGALAGFEVEQEGRALTYYVDTSGLPVPEETGMVLVADDEQVARIWLHPADPRLPALAVAAFPASAERLARRFGIAGPVTPELISYRPGKRAVLRLQHPAGEHYLKVLPPDRAGEVVALHESFASAGAPVPRATSWADLGCILLPAAPGTPGPEASLSIPAAEMLDAIDATRAALGRARVASSARDSLAKRRAWYAERLLAIAPDLTDEIAAIERGMRRGLRDVTLPTIVHGDLHLGQLFFEGAEVSAVIDLDTAGVGDRDDDSAAFIAHARTSAMLNAERAKHFEARALTSVADEASGRWLDSKHAKALTAVHLVAHGLSAAEAGAKSRARALIDDALELVAA